MQVLLQFYRILRIHSVLIQVVHKIKMIQNYPESRKIKDVQVFLGFANFHYQFIHNYSNMAILLI